MTWDDLAENHYASMRFLWESKTPSESWRAVCGRAYYAGYARVTAKLPTGIAFAHGWQNPQHVTLPSYVDKIPAISQVRKKRLKAALRRLRHRREDADYRPGIVVNESTAKESVRDAFEIFELLR